MRNVIILGVLAGTALLTVLVTHYGAHAIAHAVRTIGWDGFAAIIVFHGLLIGLMGIAWWVLGFGRPDARPLRFVWGRLMREAASEALPFSQIGGFVLGARALTLCGVAAAYAAASTIVDVTADLIAQLAYTLIGLALLARLQPENTLVLPVLCGVIVMTVLAGVFAAVQARGAGAVDRAASRLAQSWLGTPISASGCVKTEIHTLHACPVRLAASASLHLIAWLCNGVEAWLALRLLGAHVTLAEALVIDSLLYGIRSVAFMIPNAIGVQEGGYIMLGALFGVGADVSLALSLVRRGRDLVIGAPVLLAWQMIEGRRAWRIRAA
jgi:putative membrane protein